MHYIIGMFFFSHANIEWDPFFGILNQIEASNTLFGLCTRTHYDSWSTKRVYSMYTYTRYTRYMGAFLGVSLSL